MMRKQLLFLVLVTMVSGVCYAQGFNLEYEYSVASYLSGNYDTLDLNDFDGDGTPEIVIRDVEGWPDSGTIVILDSSYSELWSYTRSGLSGDFSCSGFADMDGDGNREMIVGYYDVNQSAYAKDVVDVPSGAVLGTFLHDSNIDIYDFDGDGKAEIAVSGGSETVLQIWGLDPASSVDTPNNYSADVSLRPNFPNPFNPQTVIKYQVQVSDLVQLDIVDLRGHVVRTLVNEAKAPGDHEVVWDGTNEQGLRQASGSYLYVLHVGEFTASRKLLLLK